MIERFSYQSPIGKLIITIKDDKIVSLTFSEEEITDSTGSALKAKITSQLDEYFQGKRTSFKLPISPQGTDFQKSVWNQLLTIPYGETKTYLELAVQLGDKKKLRAAGGANSKNPIAILIPCHRVIGANKKLVGYAGGIWRKKWLLEHELNNNIPKTTLF